MRRMIWAGVVAVSLAAPGVALAKPTTGLNSTGTLPSQQLGSQLTNRTLRFPNGAAIGGGMDAGNEPGHVTGPGNAPIDNSTRGPINDVQPGRGSADTHQSRDPKPVY